MGAGIYPPQCRSAGLPFVAQANTGDRRRCQKGRSPMKYLFLLYADESGSPAPGSPELQAELEAYGAFFEEVDGRGQFQAGDPVQPSASATTVTVRDGRP